MKEEVNTRELEMKILQAKVNKLTKSVDELSRRIKTKEISADEAISEFENHRKELVDCVALQLGVPVIGPLASMQTIKVISQLDDLLFNLKIISIFGTGL